MRPKSNMMLAENEGRGAAFPLQGKHPRIVADRKDASAWQVPPAAPQDGLTGRFRTVAQQCGNRIAASCGDLELSYATLDDLSNRLANRLLNEGVGRGALVGLHVGRDLDILVGILGILKAGAAYLPMDPVYPADRIAFMAEDAGVAIIVTSASLAGNLHDSGARLVDIADCSTESGTDPQIACRGNDPAYVIYTSGSTGKPKGVTVSHHNVLRLFDSTAHWFGFDDSDVWTLFHSYSFDFSVWEIWGALLYGGRVVVVPAETSRSTESFRRLVLDEGVTVLNQTPSAFRRFIQADQAEKPACYALRHVIFGGEALEFQSLRPWFDRYGDEAPRLINMYGITETTVHVTYRPVTMRDLLAGRGSIIGEPIPDLTMHILDEGMQPSPTGVCGEIYVGGAGVASGYLNRPELTAERFLPDPFSETAGARLYRTGDLALRNEEGEVEYLGRADHQVKIRGFRIELGEIEAQIAADPAIANVAVIARPDCAGEQRIVAYLVTGEAMDALVPRLRTRLRADLPDYMVPSHFVPMDQLPLTENGKLDRAKLPEPGEAQASAAFVAPEGPRQELIAGIWRDVLRVDRVGAQDDFFELGGYSLLVIEVLQRLRAAGLTLSAGDIFMNPTVAAMAEMATVYVPEGFSGHSRIPANCPSIRPDMLDLVDLSAGEIATIERTIPGGAANIQDIYPLTPLQEGILYHHRVTAKGDPYLVTTLMAATSREQVMRYAAAMQAVVDRHDILRSAFLGEGLHVPVQVVCRQAQVPVEELALDPAGGDIAAQLMARFDMRRHRLPVDRAPAIRLFYAHDKANDRWLILRSHHHLIEDHTTDELMSGEIIALMADQGASLPEAVPFRHFVAHTKEKAQSDVSRAYFRETLGDVDEPTIGFALGDTASDAGIDEARLRLGGGLATRLRSLAKSRGVSVASLFHLAWGIVLARSSGREDVTFGTVLFGRMQAGENARNIFGPMINTLPVRLRLGDRPVGDALSDMHGALAGLLRHEHAALSMAQNCTGLGAGAPLFNALINFRHVQIRGDEAHTGIHAMGAAIAQMGLELLAFEERTNFALELSVDDLGDDFMLEAQARAPVAPADLCASVEAVLTSLANLLEGENAASLNAVEHLSDGERARLLHRFNDTRVDYGTPERLHAAFEAQAARSPDAIALEFEGKTLSYGDLDRRANRLAHVLRRSGVGPDVLVGICADRSLEMVVAIYAVLKAGGAYAPLDPALPSARLADMLDDAAPRVVLCQPHLREGLPAFTGAVIELEPDCAGLESEADTPPEVDNAPGDLAYVIFTSGSTGRPKAAMNEHRGIVNRLNWMQAEYGLTAGDRVLQKTPFSFDVSVWEFFWPLMVGARLVIARPEGHRDSAYLAELIRQSGITTLHFVPSMLRVFLEEPAAGECTSIRRVICSGEALSHDLQQAFFARFADADLHNLYGPTEAAVDVTHWTCQRGGEGTVVPIGRPVANTAIHILDDHLRPVAHGAVGHIHIGGVQVGRGYLNRPELTAERFVADPFADGEGARLYKTGDIARYLPDGAIEYLGRSDFQVKIRGQRIELGEIEARLETLSGVSQCVVIAREDAIKGAQLVAYVVAEGGVPDVAQWQADLANDLPAYMVPAIFVLLDALPLTPSGKTDRRALPDPSPAQGSRNCVAPRNEIEAAMAMIWQDMLGIAQVGIDDDFFALGGHSLLALQMLVRVERQLGLRFPIRSVVEGRTIRNIAERLPVGGAADLPDGLVRLRGNAGQKAIFCIPGAGGVALQFENLAQRLGGDRAVYAFELHDLDFGRTRWPSMQDYAEIVADMMQRVQPDGPFAMIGFSSGGNLAVEVAAVLERRGHRVETLWVVDAYAPGTIYLTSQRARWRGHFDEIAGLPLRKVPNHLRFRARRMFGFLPTRRKEETELEYRLRLAEERAEKAQKNYVSSDIAATIHWTRASGTIAENFWATFVDPTGTGGWSEHCAGVEVYHFDCGHHALLHDPQLTRLTDYIARSLSGDRAGPSKGNGGQDMVVKHAPASVETLACRTDGRNIRLDLH
jgi:amino acid adenylation domain-containing protein